MSFKVQVRGYTIEVSTAEEVIQLLSALGGTTGGGSVDVARGQPMPSRSSMVQRVLSEAVSFLKELRDHEDGIDGSTLASSRGLAGGRGLGPYISSIRKAVTAQGQDFEDAVDFEETSDGRIWKPGPRIDMVIRHLEEILTEA